MSDAPEQEVQEVTTRVRALLPEGWPLYDEAALPGWLDALDRAALVQARKREVARVVLADALRRLETRRAALQEAHDRVRSLLTQEDAAIGAARAAAARTAAHLLGAVRRHTEGVLVDLHPFLVTLEAQIPDELAALDDLGLARRVLPHWLDAVVRGWLDDRLVRWRVDLLADLEEILVQVEDDSLVELLPPAIHPPPLAGDGHWVRRLGVSAALGAGAALAVVGLWLPSLLAVGGGLAWSGWGADGREQADREQLAAAAVDALRAMGRQLDQALREQLASIEQRLDGLAAEAEEAARTERAADRSALQARLVAITGQLDALVPPRDQLLAVRDGLDAS